MCISCTWWGVLRALLRLLSCGVSLYFVFFLFLSLFQSKRFYDELQSGLRIPNFSGFRILFQCRFWIPIHWIPDSKSQNFVDSGLRILSHGAIYNIHVTLVAVCPSVVFVDVNHEDCLPCNHFGPDDFVGDVTSYFLTTHLRRSVVLV